MPTTSLAQRLYDKISADSSHFRSDIGRWRVEQAQLGFQYSGSAVEIFWQLSEEHLREKIAAYFEWIEVESTTVEPSTLRRLSIEQCVGAVYGYSRQIRQVTIDLHKAMARITDDVDLGQWEGVDETAIVRRGTQLLNILGLEKDTKLTSRLNRFAKDHFWIYMALAILAISITSVTVAIITA